ncbi:MAG: TerB N-terminal domain-containing protein [Oscillospiraceae bacterium]|jgi:hypothetical protein|nr:TerB N-terminal domain-containing protein [Oscillospiraceae bacterium]
MTIFNEGIEQLFAAIIAGYKKPSSYEAEKLHPKQLSEPYNTFAKMRKIGGAEYEYGHYRYYMDDGNTFYKEAVFMQDFIDDYDKIVPFDAAYSSYSKMDDSQLRTYFTWRTKVRQGHVENISISYAFCYLYELLNDIGVIDATDGINKLIAFWSAFKKYSDRLDSCLLEWIRDYFVVHHAELTEQFAVVSRRFPVPCYTMDVEQIKKTISCDWDDLKTIELSSSFKITNGRFYKANDAMTVEKCACYVVRSLAKLFKDNGVDFRKMFHKMCRERMSSLFKNIPHKTVSMPPAVVKIDALESIKRSARGWHREYLSFDAYKSVVGYIMKCIEIKMRKAFGYKKSLQMPSISQLENGFLSPPTYRGRHSLRQLKTWKGKAYGVIISPAFEQTIVKAILEYCQMAHVAIKDEEIMQARLVTIDMSKLAEIKRDHEETAQKLILSEDMQEEQTFKQSPPATVGTGEMSGVDGFVNVLSREELVLVSTLLAGGQAPANSEMLIEAINGKALSVIADNVIDCAEGVVCINDFYFDDLKTAAGGQNQ